MKEIASAVWQYFQDNLLMALAIAFVAGFLASKTVTKWGKSNFAVYFIVGVLGSFLGQFAIRYFGLEETLEMIPGMRPLFDILAAYFGAFVIATIVHLVKPM